MGQTAGFAAGSWIIRQVPNSSIVMTLFTSFPSNFNRINHKKSKHLIYRDMQDGQDKDLQTKGLKLSFLFRTINQSLSPLDPYPIHPVHPC
jgi:hypothetical protein